MRCTNNIGIEFVKTPAFDDTAQNLAQDTSENISAYKECAYLHINDQKRNSSGGKSGVRTVGTAAEIKRKSRKRKNGSRRLAIIKTDCLKGENIVSEYFGSLIVSREERKK